MAGDEYFAAKGSLKLKGVIDPGLKKKKKKRRKESEMQASTIRVSLDQSVRDHQVAPTKTKAELMFEERRRKREEERILKKASKTHKEKVEEFNRHLDSLTEHFDIPKVSWTK